MLPFVLNLIDISAQKALLERLFTHYLIAIFIKAHQLLQHAVCINVGNQDTNNLNRVTLAKFLDAVRSLPQRIRDDFSFTEHASGVLLIRLQLCQEDVHFALLHLVYVAKVHQQLVRLVERQSHITEMLHKSAQLIKYQIRMLGCVFIKFGFFRLHYVLKFAI